MCPDPQRLQAYFDGELEPAQAAEVEQHVRGCAACRAELAQLRAAREALRGQFAGMTAPQPLRARILRALDAEATPAVPAARVAPARARPFWLGLFSGVAGSAVAAALAFLLLFTPQAAVLDQLVAAHVDSLLPNRLIAVVSTDRHTVRPWFAGRTDVSPAVADFAEQGYRLVGGRVDRIDRQRAAVVVYQHGAHIINVFVWKARQGPPPADTTRRGDHMAFWNSGDLAYCAVSDAGWSELAGLEQLLKTTAAQELSP